MKAKKSVFAMAALMAIGSFVSCEETSITEEDSLYEQGINGSEIKNQDTRVFDVELDVQSIEGSEIKNQDT